MKENSALGRSWKQARQELFSPEEIAASDARVELMLALSNARKEKGLTQKQLSEMTGIKQSAISRLENGNANTQIDSLIKLFAAMNMKMQVVPIGL